MEWTAARARRVLDEIFEAPDCAAEPEAYDAWCAEEEAAEARREDLALYLGELGFPEDAARVLR